jgi:hypothetical protein
MAVLTPMEMPPRMHVTYWWQIEALLKFQTEAARQAALLAWANVELRNDE